jgi:3-phenylpropionate/cinnamic acid dioxygenase small subunit|tara:strand:- start:63 stop:248 length:186 start_codon:yes stop_codon:yes gene_type:complete
LDFYKRWSLDWFFLKSLYLCYEKDACSFYTITGIEDKSSEENLKMVQELIRLKKEFDEQKE